MSGLLDHVFSCQTGSEVDIVMIKPVLTDRWVGICHACEYNPTIASDQSIHIIGN